MFLVKKLFNTKVTPFFILSFPVFVDILNGILQGPEGEGESMVGTLYRGSILLFSLPFISRYRFKRFLFTLVIVGVASLLFHLMMGYFTMNDLSQFIKVLYGFFFLAILLGHKQFRDKDVVCDCAIFYGLTAALSLIVCKLIGVGYASYVEGTFGIRGFFIAMNDVGLAMLLLNALSLYRFLDTGQLRYFFFSICIGGACMLVGSMTCYLGTGLLYIIYLFCPLLTKRNKSLSIVIRRKTRLSFIVLLCLCMYAVGQVVTIIMEDSYLSHKYEDIGMVLAENTGRASLIDAGKKVIEKRPFTENLFGSGDVFLMEVSRIGGYGYHQAKGVESDFWDLYGSYGLFFAFITYLLPLMELFYSLKSFLKLRELLFYWSGIITFFFLGHSIYGGHAFTSPLSMSYYVIAIYLIEKYKERRKQSITQPIVGANNG